MTTAPIPLPAKRGRPRSEQVEQAILRAAADLLVEVGIAAMTIEDVAQRAGVGKASIYRRWSSKGTLALDAFMVEFLATQQAPDTGALEGDLLQALRSWVRTVHKTPTGQALTGIIAQAQHDPELAAAWRDRVVLPVRAQHRRIIEAAIERGEIPASSDPDVILDMLFGPVYHRLLHRHRPVTDGFVRRVVAMIVAGARAGAAGPPKGRPTR